VYGLDDPRHLEEWYGLTGCEHRVLVGLAKVEPTEDYVTGAMLVERTGQPTSTVYDALGHLTEQGLISNEPLTGATDHYWLTDVGGETLQSGCVELQSVIEKLEDSE
jgi:Fe2+ or Zn2+ uptake regulation protein